MPYSKLNIIIQFYKAVYYSKLYNYPQVKVALFGLLLSLSALNESDCNSFQETGQTYYVYNPEFPNKYKGENSRTWKMTHFDVIKLNCSLEMVNLLYKCCSRNLHIFRHI